MRNKLYPALFVLSIFLFLLGCDKGLSPKEQFKKEEKAIQQYISDHNLQANRTKSGLYYVIQKKGKGEHPQSKDKVRVRYKGYTTDGKVFDKNETEGITFSLQRVIEGWQEGIQKFKEGGKGILLIPSKLAYGPQGAGNIDPNTILIFDIELISIVY